MIISAKIKNDKYYTPPDLAQYIVNKTKEIIGEENITEYIEPSAGAGVFLDYLEKENVPYLAYDIEPEDNRIIKQDFLALELEYKKGRCVIGNPPFGERNALAVKFFKHSIKHCDYISFILPITQLDNTQKLYEFDLLYSEDLGVIKFSHLKNVHCCFNIYKRPNNGFNSKPDYTLKDITLIEYKRGKNTEVLKNYDFAICTWGNGSCGKIPEYIGQYAQEHYLIINNEKLRDKILEVCKNTDWKNEVAPPNTSSKKIQSWRIYKYIKEKIPEIQ